MQNDVSGTSRLGATELLLTEVTARMDLVRLPGESIVVEQLSPFEQLVRNGAPADPIPFSNYIQHRGRRADVACYNNGTNNFICRDVLFRCESIASEEDTALGRVEVAYWALPDKAPIETIMGHVQICAVLRRCRKDPNDSDSENEEEEEEDDIVFEKTNQFVAVKVNYWGRMQRLRGRHAEDPLNEIAAMQIIGNHHPNVLGCLEVLFDGENLNVVLPYLDGGDFFEVMQENLQLATPGMHEGLARYWFRQICEGLEHLHGVGICHRDLSPENVMIHGNQACIIIDMGMALRVPYTNPDDPTGPVVDISRGMQKRLIRPQGACGKLPYMSPEIYRSVDPFDSGAVDVWTAGTILFCMLTGNRSYQRPHRSDPQFHWMTHGLPTLLNDWGVELSDDAVDLLKGMLQIEPRNRLTLEEVMAHAWLAHPDTAPE